MAHTRFLMEKSQIFKLLDLSTPRCLSAVKSWWVRQQEVADLLTPVLLCRFGGRIPANLAIP